mmetsp:Transcript_25841/g.88829  ORF Transcript_25841/g.88829 Transcript_25841/m.88829 type:complete len:508 (+) Transcript_25841:588-2111(+)
MVRGPRGAQTARSLGRRCCCPLKSAARRRAFCSVLLLGVVGSAPQSEPGECVSEPGNSVQMDFHAAVQVVVQRLGVVDDAARPGEADGRDAVLVDAGEDEPVGDGFGAPRRKRLGSARGAVQRATPRVRALRRAVAVHAALGVGVALEADTNAGVREECAAQRGEEVDGRDRLRVAFETDIVREPESARSRVDGHRGADGAARGRVGARGAAARLHRRGQRAVGAQRKGGASLAAVRVPVRRLAQRAGAAGAALAGRRGPRVGLEFVFVRLSRVDERRRLQTEDHRHRVRIGHARLSSARDQDVPARRGDTHAQRRRRQGLARRAARGPRRRSRFRLVARPGDVALDLVASGSGAVVLQSGAGRVARDFQDELCRVRGDVGNLRRGHRAALLRRFGPLARDLAPARDFARGFSFVFEMEKSVRVQLGFGRQRKGVRDELLVFRHQRLDRAVARPAAAERVLVLLDAAPRAHDARHGRNVHGEGVAGHILCFVWAGDARALIVRLVQI